MITVTKADVGDWDTDIVYEVSHSNSVTTLRETLKVNTNIGSPFPPLFKASITIDDCEADSYDGVLTKMADWLDRLAEGIRQRGTPDLSIAPFYTNVTEPKEAE